MPCRRPAHFLTFEPMKSIVACLAALLVICGCSTKKDKSEVRAVELPVPTEKINIAEELPYDSITRFIGNLKTVRNLDTGKQSIIHFLQKHYPSFKSEFLNEVDLHALRAELLEKIEDPFSDSPPEDDIRAFFFGLFISDHVRFSESKRPVTIIYITGSKRSPENDPDGWTNDPAYFPEEQYYIIPDTFTAINRRLEHYTNTTQIEEVIFSGIINLILGNSLAEIKKYTGSKEFYVGAGFDEATIFILGKVD
jgi:hypothetical protein